jgi:hypothetical protein
MRFYLETAESLVVDLCQGRQADHQSRIQPMVLSHERRIFTVQETAPLVTLCALDGVSLGVPLFGQVGCARRSRQLALPFAMKRFRSFQQ